MAAFLMATVARGNRDEGRVRMLPSVWKNGPAYVLAVDGLW
ncbi:hypothetical protein CCACVL1_26464 [Corchorus capsularis]|uniref:Uncharacterized protein n=1 Tax=Corchorus capsularis TaxID=210143 RepID=A0A1R3GER9_COCAP|nr:hypothetical protein CCACVL1_26464 [Corchorus capsularis]